nr:putative ribonuclease H-like domain-containing protein [Tanacetum cinerariifolium]
RFIADCFIAGNFKKEVEQFSVSFLHSQSCVFVRLQILHFDPIVQTPENYDDEGNDDANLGMNVGGEERHDVEDDDEELYRDVNINLEGRDVQITNVHTTQEFEDTHVNLTLVNPDGQQQSSSVSSQFVTSMLNPSLDAGIDSLFESTPRVDVQASTTVAPLTLTAPTLSPPTIPTISQLPQAPTPPTTTPSTFLQNLLNFGLFFGFDHRLKTLEANFSEFMQTNQFAGVVSSILGIVKRYMDQRMKEAVKVKVQVFKILPKIEKIVNKQLEAKFLTRSSNSSKTSYAVAADLSELELKKILIEKMESNKFIHRSDQQKNLYKALVDAYECDKIILDTYGDSVMFKRRRDDADKVKEPSAGSNRGSKRKSEEKEPESTSAPKEKATKTTGKSTEGSKSHQKTASESAPAEEPMQTTQDLEEPSHQEFETCRRVIPFDHFINNDLEYLRGGVSSRKYITSVTKTKAADYGHIKWIEDLFYGFAVNRESARVVYSKRRIIVITKLQIIEWHNYKHLEWITMRKDDDKLYRFKEGDYKRLRIQDIEYMLLLLVQGKLTNLTVEECFAFNVSKNVHKKHCHPMAYVRSSTSDGTLNDVRTAMDDCLKGIRVRYLPQAIWRRSDKERAATMIQAIDKQLKTRRIMRSLEKLIGGRLNYPECELCRSYDHFTSRNNRVIHIKGGVLAKSSQYNESSIRVKCNTCGCIVLSTSDHNEFDHFRHIMEPIWYLDSGCSRSMTGFKSYLHKYVEQPGLKIVFSDNSSCITEGYGLINCGAPRRNDVYVLDMLSLTPMEPAFFAKASKSVNWLWHKRLSHLNFKNINKLAKQNKVLGLPSLVYSKDHLAQYVKKRKHHRASFKTKQNFSIRKCLHLLHMDLFKPEEEAKETYNVTFDESMEAIRSTNTLVDEIGIDDSSRYPPDEFQEDDPSRKYQVDYDVSYYIIPHRISLTKITQENHVPKVIAPNEPEIPHIEDTEGLHDLINTEGIHEQNFHILNQASTSSHPAPQDRWSRDQHIKLVNIMGNPGEGMLTRSMAAKLIATPASECLFANFLSEIEPKKEEGTDYDETFAPVARMEAIMIFLDFATYMNFKVYQLDVKSAFANGKLKKEVYVRQPPGLKVDDKGILICQEQYTRNLLKKYEISDSSSVKTPMVPPNNLGPDLAGKPINETSYWGMIGSLIHYNGDSRAPTRVVNGILQPVAPTTAEQRLQKLISQLEILEVSLSPKDINLKFLRSLPSDWRTNTFIWRNKIDLEEQSLDDLFNSLKIYEAKVKSYSSASTSTQNIAFVSSSNTDNTNEPVSVAASVSAVSVKMLVSSLPNVDSLSNAVIYSFFASQSSSPQLDNDDLKQIDADDLEEMDLKWQMGMLTWSVTTAKGRDTLQGSVGSDESLPPSPIYDRYQSGNGYHAVPPSYTGTFMPPKPNLVCNNVPNDVETNHPSFNVKLSPTKHEQDLYHTIRPSAPIIKDWVSDFKDESETKTPQNIPSFVQSIEQVKSPRHSVQHVETSIPAITPKPASPKPTSNGKCKNRKACFVGNHNQYAQMTFSNPQRHVVPAAVLTQSKLVPINAVPITTVRPVGTAVPKLKVTRPNQHKTIVTKPNSPTRRHINCSPSPKASNSPPRVTAVQAPVGNPQHALKDKGVIDSGCLRHMTGNMSYLFDFEELNGGYVFFVGNPKGGKISGKGKIRTGKLDFDDVYFVKELKFNLFSVSQMYDKKNSVLFTNTECLVLSFEFKLPDESQVLLRVHRENNMYIVNLKNIISSGDLTCLFAKATLDESNLWHRRLGHINFKTMNKLVKGSGPTWLFDIDTLTMTMNYQSVTTGNQSNPIVGFQDKFDAEKIGEETDQQYVLFPVWSSGSTNPQNTNGDDAFDEKEPEYDEKKPESEVNVSPSSSAQSKKHDDKTKKEAKGKNITYSDDEDDVGAEDDFNNLETSITVSPIPTTRVHKDHPVTQIISDLSLATQTRSMARVAKDQVRNKARLVAQGHTQEEGINYKEVFAPVARIEAIRLFLGYASFMGFMVYQMDVKSAFLYGTIEEEVYVCQPLGFEDPDYPDKVYKAVKAFYGLHQAPRAWYETLANYLLENGFQRGKIDQTLFIKKQKGDILFIQIYVDDNIFGLTNKDLCKSFEKLMKDKFQMSSIRELTFVLGLQVEQKKDGIFISQDKYVAEILRKFRLTDGKSASTPIDIEKSLLKDLDGEDVDVHTYRSMIGSLMYLTSSKPDIMFAVCACVQVTPKASHLHAVKRIFKYLKGKPHLGLWKSTTEGCQFLGCRLISWQCKKQTVVATSSTEAEYVAAVKVASLSGQEEGVVTEDTIRDALHLDDAEGKGFYGVKTPLFEGMVVAQEVGEGVADEVHDEGVPAADVVTEGVVSAADDDAGILMNLLQELMDTCTALTKRVEHLKLDKIAQALEITRVEKKAQRIDTSDDTVMDDVSNQGKMIADMDADADGRTVESQAEIYKIELDHANKGVVVRDPEESTTTTSTIIHSEAKSKDKSKGILVEEPKPLKKQTQIEEDKKYARELEAELNRTIDWDEVIDHVNKNAKEDKSIKRYQVIKRKPQTEAQVRKNMMVYLKNVAGFKMDYFKEESRALKRINETPAEKASKRQKLDEEVEELKRHLQIVPNKEDNVYTEATPRARKLILLVERKYPLTRFTLDQMLNNVRLEVEEESEVLGKNYSSIEQINSIQQLLTDSLITETKADIGEIIYSDLITKLLNKSRLKYVSYPRFISCALQDPSKVTDIELIAHIIAVNNQKDSLSPPPLDAKLKKGKSQTVTLTLPKSQGPEASGAFSRRAKDLSPKSHPLRPRGNKQPLDRDITSTTPDEYTAKSTPHPEGSLRDKDPAFLLFEDELEKESDEEDMLAAGDDMDEDSQDVAEVRTPSPNQTQPEPIAEKQWEQHKEAAVSYADLKASIKEYCKENIAHRDQTDQLVASSMSSLDKSNSSISDLYKGLNVITKLLKDINNAAKDDPATKKKIDEAIKPFTKISDQTTKILSLVKTFDFSTLQITAIKISQTALKHEVSSLKQDTSKIKSMMTEIYQAFKGQPSLDPLGSVTLTLAFTHIPANVKGENATNTATEEPPSHTEGETRDITMETLISSIYPTKVQSTHDQPITSIISHPKISQATLKTDKGKGIATESIDDPSKKLVPASTIICPDPDETIRVKFIINGKTVYLTEQEIQEYWDKEEKMKKAVEETKLLAMFRPEVIKVIHEEAKKLEINPKKAISTKASETFKKAQDVKHEVLKREHSKKLKRLTKLNRRRAEEYMWTMTKRIKHEPITDVRIHPNTKPIVASIFRNNDKRNFDVHNPFKLKKIPEELGIQSALPASVPEQVSSRLPEGVLFVNNMVIEEPEYGIFFTDVFGDQTF